MKCRREWNSFELSIVKRDTSEGPSFKRRDIKEENGNRAKTFYSNICLNYRENNSVLVFMKQGDVEFQLNDD